MFRYIKTHCSPGLRKRTTATVTLLKMSSISQCEWIVQRNADNAVRHTAAGLAYASRKLGSGEDDAGQQGSVPRAKPPQWHRSWLPKVIAILDSPQRTTQFIVPILYFVKDIELMYCCSCFIWFFCYPSNFSISRTLYFSCLSYRFLRLLAILSPLSSQSLFTWSRIKWLLSFQSAPYRTKTGISLRVPPGSAYRIKPRQSCLLPRSTQFITIPPLVGQFLIFYWKAVKLLYPVICRLQVPKWTASGVQYWRAEWILLEL